jgi:hypothetical protein
MLRERGFLLVSTPPEEEIEEGEDVVEGIDDSECDGELLVLDSTLFLRGLSFASAVIRRECSGMLVLGTVAVVVVVAALKEVTEEGFDDASELELLLHSGNF